MNGASNESHVRDNYNHYHKPCPYEYIDVYRVLSLWNVTDPCIQHAIKKLLVAGDRGVKNVDKDIREAIVSLQRWQEMRQEEQPFPTITISALDPATNPSLQNIVAQTSGYRNED